MDPGGRDPGAHHDTIEHERGARQAIAKDLVPPLAVGRERLLAPTLSAWLAGANELNRTMSAPEHWTVTPIVVVTHPRQ